MLDLRSINSEDIHGSRSFIVGNLGELLRTESLALCEGLERTDVVVDMAEYVPSSHASDTSTSRVRMLVHRSSSMAASPRDVEHLHVAVSRYTGSLIGETPH